MIKRICILLIGFVFIFFQSCKKPIPHSPKISISSNILDFGAIPNDGKDDSKAVQAAVDFAIRENKSSLVYCPPGVYDLDQGIKVVNQKRDGEYFFLTLTLSGHIPTYGADQNIGKTTVFRMKNPGFGVAFQMGRNCMVENIVFEGCAKFTTDPATIIEWKNSDWGSLSTTLTNRFSPSCAIVIDPFHVNVSQQDRYKDFESNYTNKSNGGSSMVLIRGCSFFNHYIAIANNPSNGVQNGDNIRAENCHVSTCHTFWSCGQTQSRGNSIENVYGLFLHTFISGRQIGNQLGTPPTVSNLNLAGFCKQVMDVGTGFSGINFYRSYMESVWSLGIASGLSTSFDQCQISFVTPNSAYFMPPFQLLTSSSVAFRDCNIQYFANCTVKMPILFRARSLILSGGSIEAGVVVADGYTNAGGDDMHKVSYDNVQIKCLNKVAGKKTSEKPHVNLKDEIIMGGEVIISSDGGMYVNAGTTYFQNHVEDATIQIDPKEKTAHFITNDPKNYNIGDNIFTLYDVDPKLCGFNTQSTVRSPLGYISNISQNKITVLGVPYGFINRKDRIIVVKYPTLNPDKVKGNKDLNQIKYFEKK